MAHDMLMLACVWGFLASAALASASTVEHTFVVQNMTVTKLCETRVITAVNNSSPGPLIRIHEGDTLLILSAWADGPSYVTQCPITPGKSYTYKFTITGQEGTLWWHAHYQSLRATVYGGLIIYPRKGHSYPFPKPYQEFPIILGEWWNANVVDVENEGLRSGGVPNYSDAHLINGHPGHLHNCSNNDSYKFEVIMGKTYLLRIINAALNNQLFFKVANHKLTVVAIDASYTKPYRTDVVLVAPGQTTDVLLTAKRHRSRHSYYIAATPYTSAPSVSFDNTTTTGVITYRGTAPSSAPHMPALPAFNDTPTAHKFNSNITGLVNGPFWSDVPLKVDEHMFMTVGLGLTSCGSTATCDGPLGLRLAASMNNFSFQLPTTTSVLEAFAGGNRGVYNATFPDAPLVAFDYTNASKAFNTSLVVTQKSTTVKKLKFNATVEIVFQDTALFGVENHPIHIHGFNFHVLAQGFGNYNPLKDRKKFNLVNPQVRNTIGVPVGGWAAIRFQANNPGAWIMHCHLDVHLQWGLATVFLVEDGETPSSTLPPPPEDLPKC